MAASILAPLPPLHTPPTRSYDQDDLLALRELEGTGFEPHGEDFTDDLEDLVSLSIAQHLRSKRSQQGLLSSRPNSLLPSLFPPATALRLASSSTAKQTGFSATSAALAPISPSRPTQQAESLVRRGDAVNRERLLKVPDECDVQSSPRMQSSYAGSEAPHEVGSVEQGWETLQVGGASRASLARSSRGDAMRSSGPTATKPSSKSSRAPHLRQRAATHSPSTLPSTGSTAVQASATDQHDLFPNIQPIAEPVPPRSRSQPRQKSLSTAGTASSRTHRGKSAAPPQSQPSRRNLTTAEPPVAAEDASHWADSPAPLIYRTSKGDLDYGESASTRQLRPADRVLPAVARRLEAERLAALARQDGDAARLLVCEWGADGSPRRAVELPAVSKDDDAQHHRDKQSESVNVAEPGVDSPHSLQTSPSSFMPPTTDFSSSRETRPNAPSHEPASAGSPTRADLAPPPTTETVAEQASSPIAHFPPDRAASSDATPPHLPVDRERDADQAGCCRCVVS